MKDFWELLNLVEDKIESGYKKIHEVPEFSTYSTENKKECRDCPLYLIRNRIVYGKGSDSPRLMIIGTWPVDEDEESNSPISGKCGEFLEKWIKAVKLSPFGECYITNLLKCRSGWNKRGFNSNQHLNEEIEKCFTHLELEIERLKPEVILTLGEKPAQILTETDRDLETLRGHIHLFKGIPVVSTYHPEIALENYEALRAPVWEDLKLVIECLNG